MYAAGPSLQNVPGWIRRVCSHIYYHDLDIVNCGPAILSQIIEKVFGTNPPRIREAAAAIKFYATNRSDVNVFKNLRDQEPELKDIPDKALKNMYLLCLHGGDHTNHFRDIGLPPDHEPIAVPLFGEWEKHAKKLMKKLSKHPSYIASPFGKELRQLYRPRQKKTRRKNQMC